MKNKFINFGGCNGCKLRSNGECKLTAILSCDFFREDEYKIKWFDDMSLNEMKVLIRKYYTINFSDFWKMPESWIIHIYNKEHEDKN